MMVAMMASSTARFVRSAWVRGVGIPREEGGVCRSAGTVWGVS